MNCAHYVKGVNIMEWTQEKLENLYQEVNKKAKEDPEFLKALLKDPKAAMEQVAGCEVPDGYKLSFVDGETNHAGTYSLPNFTGDEIDLKQLNSVVGGIANDHVGVENCPVFQAFKPVEAIGVAAIVSYCAAAVGVAVCPGDVCTAAVCPVDVCGAAHCTAATGGFEGCGIDTCGADVAGGGVCGTNVDGAGGCLGDVCGANVCGADGGCLGDVCPANYCGEYGGCRKNYSPSDKKNDEKSELIQCMGKNYIAPGGIDINEFMK